MIAAATIHHSTVTCNNAQTQQKKLTMLIGHLPESSESHIAKSQRTTLLLHTHTHTRTKHPLARTEAKKEQPRKENSTTGNSSFNHNSNTKPDTSVQIEDSIRCWPTLHRTNSYTYRERRNCAQACIEMGKQRLAKQATWINRQSVVGDAWLRKIRQASRLGGFALDSTAPVNKCRQRNMASRINHIIRYHNSSQAASHHRAGAISTQRPPVAAYRRVAASPRRLRPIIPSCGLHR